MKLTTYETIASMPGGVQGNPGTYGIVDAPGLPGKKAWRIELGPRSLLWDSNPRVHGLGPGGILPGDTISCGAAYYLPSDRPDSTSWDALFELHQDWEGASQSYGGPAPGYGYMSGGNLAIVVRGGNVKTDSQGGGSFVQSQWGYRGDGHGYKGWFANGIPSKMPKGRWVRIQVTMKLGVDASSGWVRAEIDGVEAVPKTNVPTCYPFGHYLMPVNGYRGASDNGVTAVHYMWAASGDEASVRDYLASYVGAAAPPPPPPPAPSDAELLALAAVDLLKGTKISYPEWADRVANGYKGKPYDPARTNWGQALDLLGRIK